MTTSTQSKFSRRFRSYLNLAGRAVDMVRGKSYWHVDQPPGRHFVPGQLAGYFNDLTGKTQWSGVTDKNGIPMQPDSRQGMVYFPITVFQKGLGHWDAWLDSNRQDERHLDQFRSICRWGLDHQDDGGGWPVWFMQDNAPFTCAYSAMAQGEGVSVLCRGYSLDNDRELVESARRALELTLQPMESGGMTQRGDVGLVLEEFPSSPINTVLNGWIFALYGLYDFLLVELDEGIQSALDETVSTLVAHLPDYDVGYWSRYSSGGWIASPFYQALHIAQLAALEQTFPAHAGVFRGTRERFERQMASPLNRARAIGVKIRQKIADPPDVIFR